MQNGRPLNEKHPGYSKLPPKDQDEFDQLKDQKKRNGGTLPPKQAEELDKLAAAV